MKNSPVLLMHFGRLIDIIISLNLDIQDNLGNIFFEIETKDEVEPIYIPRASNQLYTLEFRNK